MLGIPARAASPEIPPPLAEVEGGVHAAAVPVPEVAGRAPLGAEREVVAATAALAAVAAAAAMGRGMERLQPAATARHSWGQPPS
mmetsp:Transcript_43364/g.75066  ORF Transcript_43364/g.75066 Transcript_43364/m.75066 type:complete len:85 (-) Transcript_43364:229-483(-)